jgi:hypothetical protein
VRFVDDTSVKLQGEASPESDKRSDLVDDDDVMNVISQVYSSAYKKKHEKNPSSLKETDLREDHEISEQNL